MNKLLKIVPAGSAVLASTTLVSYLLGLFRDRLFAHIFGASRALDAYNAAFLMPDLLFNILIASGIAAAFVPLFSEIYRSDHEKAYAYSNSVVSAAIITMTMTGIFFVVFAKQISFIVAPGFDAEGRAMVTGILRWLSLSPIMFGVSNTIGAMLVAKKRFFFYGISPILYNLGMILGAVFLSPYFGINGVAIGTVCGAGFHMLIRIIDGYLSGYKFKMNFNFKTPEFKKTVALMLPKMFGHPVELAMFWGFTVLASSLSAGSVAVMNFARDFMSVPVSLIGITFATTAFPVLSETIASHSTEKFKKTLKDSFLLIFAGSVFCAVVTFIIREPLIRLVLGGGRFDEKAIARTAMTLGIFTLGIPTESIIHLLARAFYATKNTVIPVIMSVIGLIIAIGVGYLLLPSLDILAIPVAFALASTTEMLFLIILLPYRIRQLPQSPLTDTELDPHRTI